MTTTTTLNYPLSAPAQSGAPDWRLVKAKGDNTRAKACFLLSKYQHIYQWWAGCGASKEAPGSFCSGTPICNQLITRMIGVFCGEVITLQKEIAFMVICAHYRLKTFSLAAFASRIACQLVSPEHTSSFAGAIQNGETL